MTTNNNNKEKFLYRTAESILQVDRKELSQTLVILPGRRAARFLYKYMTEIADEPIFLPDVYSIDEICKKNVIGLSLADNLTLLYTLYKSYCKIYYRKNPLKDDKKKESFSSFFFWGKMLLNDFDELDKNLIDAEIFYKNLKDYKALTASPNEYLDEEQIKVLENFFNINFDSNTELLHNFVKVWNCLYEIYTDFNDSLKAMGLAYGGMMNREFIRQLQSGAISFDYLRIHVAGFSVLNKCDHELFKILKENYNAEFYWDYDNYYTKEETHEAGIFMRENLRDFPISERMSGHDFDKIETQKKEFHIVNAPYAPLSVCYIKEWLDQIDYKNLNPTDVAIVLLDESLTPLILKSLPVEDNPDLKINLSAGYPFKQTLLYNKLSNLCFESIIKDKDGKTAGLDSEKISSEIARLAQETTETKSGETPWQLDVLKKIDQTMTSFAQSLEKIDHQDLDEKIIKSVICQYLDKLNIDLVSDATDGIQIMGLMETRALDFKYVLMMSATDNNLPRVHSAPSFIPHCFKQAYNMMSISRKTGLFAYYFYRLLHTAQRTDFVCNDHEGEEVLEMSRFIRQLLVELPKTDKIEQILIESNKTFKLPTADYFFDINDFKFINDGRDFLSASALNNLIDCPKRFYLQNVKRFQGEQEDSENYLGAAFGNVFHRAANLYYEQVKKGALLDSRTYSKQEKNSPVPLSKEEKELVDQVLRQALDNPYQKDSTDKREQREYRNRQQDIACLKGIHREMIKEYLLKLIRKDKQENNIYLLGERNLLHTIEIEIERDGKKETCSLHFKSRFDRLDKTADGITRIVDYKTGKKKEKEPYFNSLEEIFNLDLDKDRNVVLRDNKEKGADNAFEVLFYCWLLYNGRLIAQDENGNDIKDENGNYLLDEDIFNMNLDEDKSIRPTLIYLSDKDLQPSVPGKKIKKGRNVDKVPWQYDKAFNEKFEKLLRTLLKKFLETNHFSKYKMADDKKGKNTCHYCKYKILCNKKDESEEQ